MSPYGTEMIDSRGTARISFKPVDCDELIAEVLSSRPIMIDGGGVTYSGGEPTLQFEALLYMLKRLKEENIHTAIETNVTHPRLPELLPYLDLLIADLKHCDPKIHKKYTGISNEAVIENLMLASQEKLEIWIRTPLIKGFNADIRFIQDFINIYSRFNLHNVSFELLPYHELGKIKWEQCGKQYTIDDGFVSYEILNAYEKAYLEAGLKVIHT